MSNFQKTCFALGLIVLCVLPADAQTLRKQADSNATEGQPDNRNANQFRQDLLEAKSVVFLGNGFTAVGKYVSYVEAKLLLDFESVPEFINLSLPSETVSGLTEPAHKFPRPILQDRLDRILNEAKPDFVFACYGVDDGIFHPFDEQRFEAFKKGIRELIATVNDSGAKIVLITPPPVDIHELAKKNRLLKATDDGFTYGRIYEKYDEEVVEKYADWILGLKQDPAVYAVIDAYHPIKKWVTNHRAADPSFHYTADGVQIHLAGHRVMAHLLVEELGLDPSLPDHDFAAYVHERMGRMKSSWLTHVGHDHPKLRPGLSFSEQEKKIAPLNERIQKFLDEHRNK